MPSTLGLFIRHRRERLGLTQGQLADRAGNRTTQIHISRLETGRVRLPRWDRLIGLAAALKVNPGELLYQAGVITAADLPDSSRAQATPASYSDVQPRAFICPPIGVIREWETAGVFICA
jgi:transcriptional regulator with XRE-family HTH domain